MRNNIEEKLDRIDELFTEVLKSSELVINILEQYAKKIEENEKNNRELIGEVGELFSRIESIEKKIETLHTETRKAITELQKAAALSKREIEKLRLEIKREVPKIPDVIRDSLTKLNVGGGSSVITALITGVSVLMAFFFGMIIGQITR